MEKDLKNFKIVVIREVVTAYYVEAESLQAIEEHYEFEIYDDRELSNTWLNIESIEEL